MTDNEYESLVALAELVSEQCGDVDAETHPRGPVIEARCGEVSVCVEGTPEDSLADVRGHFMDVFEHVSGTFVEHVDAGPMY